MYFEVINITISSNKPIIITYIANCFRDYIDIGLFSIAPTFPSADNNYY